MNRRLTVTARLDRGLDVTDALDSDTVLVVAVDVLILKLTNLVNQDTKLVCNVRYVVVARLSPDGKLLLQNQLVFGSHKFQERHELTATSIRSLETSSILRMTFFSILTSCESFFARSGPKAPADLWRKVWPIVTTVSS